MTNKPASTPPADTKRKRPSKSKRAHTRRVKQTARKAGTAPA
jgi:hypothetical protein